MLRHFLYLDTPLVDQFLAQLEGGRFAEESEHLREAGGKKVGGDVGVSGFGGRAGLHGGKTSSSEREVERTVRQTPEAEFARLYGLLQERQEVQWLDAFDEAIWGQLRRGEIIEVEASITVSTLVRWARLAEQFAPVADVLQTMGEELDEEASSAMAAISSLGNLLGSAVPVTARAIGSPDFKFVATLNPAHLRGDVDILNGEATLLAKLQRKLRDDQTYTVMDSIPGIRGLPEAQLRTMASELTNSPEMPDMVIEAPAAVVTTVAVYR